LLYYERKLKKQGYDLIIGVDEAGRGPLAGPVVAAAVALKTTRFKNHIDDSKKLTAANRSKAFPEILKNSFYGIGVADERLIDRINIFQATRRAMHDAVSSLIAGLKEAPKHAHVIVDGRMRLDLGLPSIDIVRGDSLSKSIAAASIIAKVVRDSIMNDYDKIFPQYGFAKHKGYPTKGHRAALRRFKASSIHRKSFCCV
jgi:ribonuclease HII